jgi:hypothetical protein
MMNNSQSLISSIFKFGFTTLLLVTVSFSSVASDSDRITQLEKEVKELKIRLTTLESPQSNTSGNQKPASSSEGWKSVANWRSLRIGMEPEYIRKLLGEPSRIDGGTVAFWVYPNSGEVTFVREQVTQWREPR